MRVMRCCAQGGGGGAPDLSLLLRAGKNTLRSAAFQEEVVTQVWVCVGVCVCVC
jgi:hypothetical protein